MLAGQATMIRFDWISMGFLKFDGNTPMGKMNSKLSLAIVCAAVVSMTSCTRAIGPKSMTRDRHLYAASLSDSWKEQTLLNIVKMRYLDPPVFVDVGNIVASYSLQQGVSAAGNIIPNGSVPNATVGGFGTYSNTPTITYTPLTGAKFIRSLATPLPPDAVFSSIEAGLPADLILFTSVASINGLKNQDATLQGVAPADPDFHRLRALVRQIQLSGAVRIVVKQEAGEELVSFLSFRTKKVPPEVGSMIAEVQRLLDLDPSASEYKVSYGAVPSDNREIAVVTRSILGLMQTMAAEVGVPPDDLAKSRAFAGFEHGRDIPDVKRLIRIHSGNSMSPDAFVSVKYRNSWFWIDDGDLESKQVFSLIMMLFTMVDTGPKENQPVLTIPAH